MGTQGTKKTKRGLLGPFCQSHRPHFRAYREFSDSLTAGFSEHDPHRMMHMCGLDERFV